MPDSTMSPLSELQQREGNNNQDPSNGNYSEGVSYLSEYSNRLFGAPFQLLDSVDRRFPEVNSTLGNEYLRNFMLNSPILHIRPGMPKYTANETGTSLANILKNVYSVIASDATGMSLSEVALASLGKATLFGAGGKLQNRMFGFRETYYEYIQYVNYMCRSAALYLNLIDDEKLGIESNSDLPNGCIVSGGDWKEFDSIDWQNYRMTNKRNEHSDQIEQTGRLLNVVGEQAVGTFGDILGGLLVDEIAELVTGDEVEFVNNLQSIGDSSILGEVTSKYTTVDFMVEPIQFTESFDNSTGESFIEGTIDAIRQGVGSELAWITNSNVDHGVIDNLVNFLGDTVSSATEVVNGLVKEGIGGFASNLFSGALGSLKGQKMIYPKIYQSSESHMDYTFSITLTTPYGDPYNYYMNIVVPLLHLIALTAPRMVTSNTVASPFIVQAYIPGMCSCQLGIIKNMRIIKNPSQKHVSVNGYPLTVKVEFTIEELYNAMSISPANDPASFLFNETLNDYLCNLSGLAPSGDTYAIQRQANWKAESDYFTQGTFIQDGFANINRRFVNPFLDKAW